MNEQPRGRSFMALMSLDSLRWCREFEKVMSAACFWPYPKPKLPMKDWLPQHYREAK